MVLDSLGNSKSLGAVFPKVFAHFVSLCHILVILAIFHKMDNVEEMDKFLEKYNFPKLDQGRNRKS